MTSGDSCHAPVLLAETVAALRPATASVLVDATFGRGGHARALLAEMRADARLLVIDRDPEAVAAARRLGGDDPRVCVADAAFGRLDALLRAHGVHGSVSGMVFDLGVSSPQLEAPERGFSFQNDGPLDMRMDPRTGASAAEWLAGAEASDIARVLRTFGEERHAGRIARAIVRARERAPIDRTASLAAIVARARPGHTPGRHPATRTFQALRIFVNREIEQLEAALPAAAGALAPGGRLAVVSFHSIEDRVVKRFVRGVPVEAPPGFPFEVPGRAPPGGAELRAVGRPLRPGAQEVAGNPRARSAILRVAERIG